MPTIKFEKKRASIVVPKGTNLRQALVDNGVPVASSCGGAGICAKCAVKVIDGELNLTPPNSDELHLKSINNLERIHRISCQAEVLDDVTLDTNYW